MRNSVGFFDLNEEISLSGTVFTGFTNLSLADASFLENRARDESIASLSHEVSQDEKARFEQSIAKNKLSNLKL